MGWETKYLSDGLGQWRDEWDVLNIRLYRGHPLSDSRFVEALLRSFGNGNELLCIHRTGEKTDGMVILHRRRMGVWSQFVPHQAQSAPVLLERADFLDSLFAVLPGRAWFIELLCQDPCFVPADLLSEGILTRTQPHALTMHIELSGTFEGYWKRRSKNLIKNMRRYENRLYEESVSKEMRVFVGGAYMHDAVARFGELEKIGWKGEAGTAVAIENEQGRFYVETLTRFANSGQAKVVEYWLEGKLAASRLLIYNGEMCIILKTAYDEGLSKFAPGRLLLKSLIENKFSSTRVKYVEFYTDASSDQLAWATGQRHIVHVARFRASYWVHLHDARRNLRHWIAGVNNKKGRGYKLEDVENSHVEIQKFSNVPELPPDCAALFTTGEKESFDLSAAWFKLLETQAFTGKGVCIYVFRRNNEVRGVLPVVYQRTHGFLRQMGSLTNYYSSLYRPLLAATLTSDELASYIRLILKDAPFDILRFDAMDPAHPSFALMEEACSLAGPISSRFFCFGNWYLPVEGRSSEEYFKSLSSQVRNTVKRREKKFFDAGRGRFEIVTGEEGLARGIAAWEKIYAASWKKPEPFPNFVPELIRQCAAKGWLRLGIAFYDEEPIATQLWIVSYQKAAIYKLSYDEKFSPLSAGTILTAHLMRYVLDIDKVTEVDYLIGDDNYKKDWVSHRRERWGLSAYNPFTFGGLAAGTFWTLGHARRALRNKVIPRSVD